MQNERSFIDEIKHQYRAGGMHVKLIFANVIVFLIISLMSVIGRLTGNFDDINTVITSIFTMQTNLTEFLYHPWGIFTSMFAHIGFLHLVLNMLLLYFMGQAFEHYFGAKRLLTVYLLGGIIGGIFEILAHQFFPSLLSERPVLGASGSVMAIFIGLAFYKPNMPVSLFGLFQFKIIYLGLIYIVLDFISLGVDDGTAHFAHIGGAIVGMIAAQKPNSSTNLIVRLEKLLNRFLGFISNFPKSKAKQNYSNVRRQTDAEFNMEMKQRQEKTDQILDKIAKSGYESLSKSEKEFLFRQSKK